MLLPKILLTLFTFLFIVIPGIGMFFLIRYVIRKSRAAQPAHVLAGEKSELFLKVQEKRANLRKWEAGDLEKISNNLDYIYTKGLTGKFNGFIKTMDDEKIIAFRRIDRGVVNASSRIVALSSDFELYFDQLGNDISIEFNGKRLGKIVNNATLVDASNQILGSYKRYESSADYFLVELNQEKLAYVVKNSDRRHFTKNPFYDFHAENAFEKDAFWGNEVNYSTLTKLYRTPTDEEYKWMLALVLYEAVYFGLEFTQ